MRRTGLVLVVGCMAAVSFAARSQTSNTPQPPAQTSPPAQELPKTYLPGLGEFMGRIQVDHAKLWLAGQARNWELADYELTELKEVFSDVQDFVPALSERSRRRHDRRDHHRDHDRSGQGHLGARFQRLLHRLRPADDRVQFLPPGCQPALHHHPAAGAVEFQQSGLLSKEVRPAGRGATLMPAAIDRRGLGKEACENVIADRVILLLK